MMRAEESPPQPHYELRPAKQVERRMLIDAFQKLARAGFDIPNYRYTGMGSFYFVDFTLFHKLLGISKMLSAEHSGKIRKRVRFNQPFGFVNIEMKPIGDLIASLSKDERHIVWLDYDQVLWRGHLEDIYLAASHLSVGSILLVTVDVEPPIKQEEDPKRWKEYYEEEATEYLGVGIKLKEFSRSNLARLNAQIISRAIVAGLAFREVEFFPLFSFKYRDGHQMLSVGGMIGSESERLKINGSELIKTSYTRFSLESEPYEIRVPRVTRKERLYLDSVMPCSDKWKPKDFELSSEEILAYREIYRFFPAYAELLL